MIGSPLAAQSVFERLVMPGPLSSAHAKLESKCASCHSSFQKTAQDSKCLACHKAIRADIQRRDRFHGKFASARARRCKACHSDHKGRGFALIRLKRAGFNHNLTAWPLEGKHAGVKCAACHGNGNNYRGTSRLCATCHKSDDPHKGKLGRKCQTCHTPADWKTIKPFNHATTGFALVGAHARAQCMSCHAGQRWKGLGQTCFACHAKDDAHRGSRGTNCANCHNPRSWQSVTFDHSTTGFPLIGGHARAACAGCHGPSNRNKHPERECFACHAKDDSHEGGNGKQCADCHTARSWRAIRFDHSRTEFPLNGAHRKARCNACHTRPARAVKLKSECYACHAKDDSHEGGNGPNCGRCHNETDWKRVDFDHNTMTEFALTGKHASAQCQDCHKQPADKVKLTVECAACHFEKDVHKGALGGNCARCHDSVDWKQGVRFDHEFTRFALLGKHAALECADCHEDQRFRAKGVRCASCHVDDHHKGALGQPADCARCHNSNDWKVWRFDHDLETDYPLTGKHRGLICSACHNRPGDPAKRGDQCVDCHRRDDIHSGRFGSDCERCHVTDSFARIKLER